MKMPVGKYETHNFHCKQNITACYVEHDISGLFLCIRCWSLCVLTDVWEKISPKSMFYKWVVNFAEEFYFRCQSFLTASCILLWSSLPLSETVNNGPDHRVKGNGILDCKRKHYLGKTYNNFGSSSMLRVFSHSKDPWGKNKYVQNEFLFWLWKLSNIRTWEMLLCDYHSWRRQCWTFLEWLHPGTTWGACTSSDPDISYICLLDSENKPFL